MRKATQIFSISLVTVMALLLLSACGGGAGDSKLIGKWKATGGQSYEFKSNGTVIYEDSSKEWTGKYTANNGEVKITADGSTYSLPYSFSESGISEGWLEIDDFLMRPIGQR